MIDELLGTATAITLLCIIESTSISKTLAARAGDSVHIPKQIVSLGAANLVSAFGSGMPVSGSPTRSVLNYNSGAQTPISSIINGILLIVAIYLLSPLLHFVPKATLAALVTIVGISLIKWDTIKVFISSSKSDAATFLVTFITGLVFPLNIAIYFGVALSIALFLRKVSVPKLEEIDFNDRGELVEKRTSNRSSVSIVHVEGDLFFGSTDVFLDRMRDFVQSPNLKVVILRLLNAHHIDATASLAIANLVQFARSHDRDIILSGVRQDLSPCIEKSGLKALIGDENIFEFTPDNLTLSTRNALKRAQAIIGDVETDVILMVNPEKNPLKSK
jgi:SulP family sulfate permease